MAPYDAAEVDVVRAGSPREARAREAILPEPAEIARIVAERQAFRERGAPAPELWFRPLSLSALATADAILAPNA
jgi:hypothetical protein